MSALLEITDLVAGYGDARVLHGVSMPVSAQSVCAVVGSNGAGKTTLFRALLGLIPVTSGSIRFDGHQLDSLASHQRVARGIGLVPEGRLIFGDLSVEENLFAGALTQHAAPSRQTNLDTVYSLFPKLQERRTQPGGTLSGGEQQMLALGRGIMGCPRLLMLDEPTLGLAPAVADQVFELVPRLVELGITVLIAEQDVHRTLLLADQAQVLENGRIVKSGSGSELLESAEIKKAYLG